MAVLIKFLLSPVGRAVIIVVAVVGVAYGLYLYGYSSGREAGKVDQLEQSVEAYKNREGIDDEVSNLDDVQLCLELGGLHDDCNKLRRVEETSGTK